MEPKDFYFGVMLVDDDASIIGQHEMLLNNRTFRRQGKTITKSIATFC